MNLIGLVPYVIKAIAGMNVKDQMKADPNVIDRPFWLSGRFIGTIVTLVFGSWAASIGMDINASITNITDLANLVYDNQQLLIACGGMVAGVIRGIAGIIQKK